MVKFAQRAAILCFFSIFLAIPAFAAGARDADLVRADELIKERQHEEAIMILADFARRNPLRFEEAQQRLRRIYRMRDEFNRTADKLIHTLINDPDNNERILELSLHLYSLEHESSPLLVNFVASAREIAQFNITRTHLRRIMERGRLQLDARESLAAIRTYNEGMGFMREEFFLAGFGESINAGVIRETENINSILAAFQQTSSQMGAIANELIRAVNSGSTTGIQEITARLTIAMDNFITLKTRLYASVGILEGFLGQIRENNPETGDRNHLSFVSMVVRGRSGEPIAEGMLGAFDNYWENTIGSVINSITQYVEGANRAAIASLNSRHFPLVISSLGNMEYYRNLTPHYFDKHRQLFENPGGQSSVLFGSTILNKDINQFINIRALGEANAFLVQAANVASRQNIDSTALTRFQEGTITSAQALAAEQQTRNNILALQRSISDIVSRANQVHTDINRYHEVMHVQNAANAIGNIHAFYLAEEQQSALRYLSIAQSNLSNTLAVRRNQLARGASLLEGEKVTNEDGMEETFHYPAEALVELNSMLAGLTTELQNINTVIRQNENDPSEAQAIAEMNATVNELTSIRNQGNTLANTARDRSNQAEALRIEGERLFREAQAAFARRDYDTARDRIRRADSRLSESLAIQESASLRQFRDSQLISLDQTINRAENEAVIAEVRNMVNTARTQYYNGNFVQAEETLTRARSRWANTNSEPNEEIQIWLNFVRTALAATSGRVIPPTAPLFPEMSQLLSQAQRNYEEGVRLTNTGQRNQGNSKFDEARQLTREVRLMFPINQEAGILDLRIEQFLDPVAFNASFEQRLRNAQTRIRNTRSMDAYAELVNLSEINPNYPNMRAIIIEAEIIIGIRPPPPNPADLARSRELTVTANRIFESRQTAQYPIALEQLREAISLNPDNMEAPRIRDRIMNQSPLPGNTVLSSQDEAQYQLALREVQAGNNLAAYVIVTRLLQNPRNRNVQKVVELEQRIRF
ncbi:MAG: hypothetical protein FWC01_06185 [Treponema sp.]|nr:hypothetical protein [Treponema sp.]